MCRRASEAEITAQIGATRGDRTRPDWPTHQSGDCACREDAGACTLALVIPIAT